MLASERETSGQKKYGFDAQDLVLTSMAHRKLRSRAAFQNRSTRDAGTAVLLDKTKGLSTTSITTAERSYYRGSHNTDSLSAPRYLASSALEMASASDARPDDAEILRQMDSIKREVEESQPLLGDLEAPEALLAVYAENPQFAAKVPDYARQFSGLRRTQGDGNCAYRSFAVSLAERFLDAGVKLPDASAGAAASAAGAAGSAPSPMQAFYERTLKYLRDSLATLVDVFGYSSFTTEDFHGALLEYFEALGRPGATKETHVFGCVSCCNRQAAAMDWRALPASSDITRG